MTELHADAPFVDLIGTEKLIDHFAISRQAVFYWKKAGVPRQHRKSFIALGTAGGHDMSGMSATRA